MLFRWHELGYKIERVQELTHFWREHPSRTSRNSDIYQQESFFKLKLNYFTKNEITNETLQLIGAGEKGKLTAKLLAELDISFDWYDFNEGRVNSIPELLDVKLLQKNKKTLLTNWPKSVKTQSEILQYLKAYDLETSGNLWIL